MRLEAVLARLVNPSTTTDGRRADRAVWVLEWVGSSESVRLLAELAAGAEGAEETELAKTALVRLVNRLGPSPSDLSRR